MFLVIQIVVFKLIIGFGVSVCAGTQVEHRRFGASVRGGCAEGARRDCVGGG